MLKDCIDSNFHVPGSPSHLLKLYTKGVGQIRRKYVSFHQIPLLIASCPFPTGAQLSQVPEKLPTRRGQKEPQSRFNNKFNLPEKIFLLFSDMAAEELAALIKERKEVARRSGHTVNGDDNGDENGQDMNEENNSNETSVINQETGCSPEQTSPEGNDPRRGEDGAVVSEKANRVSSDVKQKAENRLSFDPDRWNLKVPQGIPPHIAQSAFELYDQELRNMPDREFKEFLKDWSPNSPMYLYLRELRRKVR